MATELRSIRLNSHLKQQFINRVMKENFPGDSEPCLPSEDTSTGDALYQEVMDEFNEAKNVPTWLLPNKSISKITILFTNGTKKEKRTFDLSGSKPWFEETGYWGNSGSIIPTLPYDHEVNLKFTNAEQQKADWNEQRRELERKLRELIEPLNSTKQLFNAWPDAIEYKDVFPIPDEPVSRRREVGRTDVTAEEMNMTLRMAKATFKEKKIG